MRLGSRLRYPGLDLVGPNDIHHRRNQLVCPLPGIRLLTPSSTRVSGYAAVGLKPDAKSTQLRGVPGVCASYEL
jgi:hypothetical protein